MRLALIFLLVCSFARADSLADLKSALAKIAPREPLHATVTYEASQHASDETPAGPGKVTAEVEDGPGGLQIKWSRAILDAAIAEQTARSKDRNVPTPTRSAMDGLNATVLNDYLNAGAQMLRQLASAELVSDQATSWQGRPARLLTLKITPPLSEKDKKYIKQIDVTAKIWLDADGWPLAAEHATNLKGRAMLVITFEQHERQELRYQHTGDRLVTIYHFKESQNSGGGESGQSRSVATLALEKS